MVHYGAIIQKPMKEKERRERAEYGRHMMICISLLDHPGTLNETVERFRVIGRRFGIYGSPRHTGRGRQSFQEWMQDQLDDVVRLGLVTSEGETYALTAKGREETHRFHEELERTGRILNAALSPERATFATMFVHFVLAAIKLPAALISGSVGLLNDAVDTLLDGLSSLLVFFGVKRGFEKTANLILVVLMTGTAIFTLYEAVRRIFERQMPRTDWFSFLSVIVSAFVCLVLYLYQRIAGTRNACGPLITQSIDSRNHVIAAASVAAGLIAARLDFIWLDIAVGLVVALIIGKSAIELIIELVRAARSGDEEPDYSKYALLVGMQDRQTIVRLVYMAYEEKFAGREELRSRFLDLLDTESSPALRAVGLHEMKKKEDLVGRCLDRALEDGLIEESESISVTDEGKQRLIRAGLLGASANAAGAHRQGTWHTVLALVVGMAIFAAARTGLGYLQGLIPTAALWGGYAGLTPGQAQWMGIALGGVVFALAHVEFRHAVRHIRRARRGSEKPRRLVSEGPYGRSRHPMYAGMILMYTAFMFSLGTRLSFLVGAGVAVLQAASALIEDRRMTTQVFPAGYPAYRSRVRTVLFTPVQWAGMVVLLGWGIAGMILL